MEEGTNQQSLQLRAVADELCKISSREMDITEVEGGEIETDRV